MASKSAIQRVAPKVLEHLPPANRQRLEKLLGVVDESGSAVLAEVLGTLYPESNPQTAQALLRQFREAVRLAAVDAGVSFEVLSDGQKRSDPADRMTRVSAEDSTEEAVIEIVEADVRETRRYPQDVVDTKSLAAESKIRFFVSHSHKDKAHFERLMGKLEPLFALQAHVPFELWTDRELLPGELWREGINAAMGACDIGLLFLSPDFLASPFITQVELKKLLADKRVVPVAIRPVTLKGNLKLHGIEAHQIFFGPGDKAFSERNEDHHRDKFAQDLFDKISARVTKEREVCPAYNARLIEEATEHSIEDLDPRFTRTHVVRTSLDKNADAPAQSGERTDALTALNAWISDPDAPPYCPLLGEYGMGKTTTCKALARDLLDRRRAGDRTLLPVYFDLRAVGKSAQRDLGLEEILALILKHSWQAGSESAGLTPADLVGLVQAGDALIIWDGLDEVLVHLDQHSGQMFTRQLFKLLPPPRKGTKTASRLLITCRTHYFRTLRDEQTHFRAEDRDNIRPEHYRDPFLLLPFNEEQIRAYLSHTVGDAEVDRAMEALDSIHNLRELAERPYTLSLISDQFSRIEKWKAEGRRITGLTLYREMVLSWLERDNGKHHFSADHKQAIMEHFAAELWRTGEKFWSIGEIEDWLLGFVASRPEIARHYERTSVDLLKEDLRTATFLVRDGSDRFRFAHTSLQEYFLAGYLRRALVDGKPECWDLPRPSPETTEFLGQWLLEDAGENRRAAGAETATLEALRDGYRARASELAFSYFLLAARKGFPAPTAAGFQLRGADLEGFAVGVADGVPFVLAGADFRGAYLVGVKFRNCNLRGAGFEGAKALHAEFLELELGETRWGGAELEGAVYRRCGLGGAEFVGAGLLKTQFLECGVAGSVGLEPRLGAPLGTGGRLAPAGRVAGSATLPQDSILPHNGGGVLFAGCGPEGARLLAEGGARALGSRGGVGDPAAGWQPAPHGLGQAVQAEVWADFGHGGGVNSCAWSPDGRRVVSGADDRTVRVSDAETGRVLVRMEGHEGSVWSCAWSPDGRRVVSGAADSTVRVWDAETGECLRTMLHGTPVWGCDWGRADAGIVSCGVVGEIKFWDAETGEATGRVLYHASGIVIDQRENRVVCGGPEAWRYLGWIAVDAETGRREWLPAETFGPLPDENGVVRMVEGVAGLWFGE